MNRLPRVSIGMPVYNGEKYIREALDSLLAQTFTDYELIISDNASTDGTEAICREYVARDSRIRYVRQNQNRGALANYQFVLDEAVGEYFMWAAADDVWDVNFIERLYPVSSTYQCLAFGYVQQIDVDGKEMEHPANHRKYSYTGVRFIRRAKYYIEPGFLGKANPINGIFPCNRLKEIGLSSVENITRGADVVFLYVILGSMEIRHGAPVFLYKRIHDGCAGRPSVDLPCRRKISAKIFLFIYGAMTSSMIGSYIKHSSVIQSMVLIALYPFYVSYCVTSAFLFRIQMKIVMIIVFINLYQVFAFPSMHG